MLVPITPIPPTDAEIAKAVAANNMASPFYTGIRRTQTAYNHRGDGSPGGPPFPAGVLQFEAGGQVFPFVFNTDRTRADIDIAAAATQAIPPGSAWRLTWLAPGGRLEVLAAGTTIPSTPCCGQ